MNHIHILPSELSDQIAAGEVVERPASVVKELTENSLDAGATQIEIHIKDGGKDLIKIVDNGSGMTPIDAEKCILRHATSKIQSIDDLFSVHSFGFRGEALAAISSVSEFELLTKTRDADHGSLIKVSGGKDQHISPAPANTGTTITIRHLFFPIPARLAHLKNNSTEFTHIYKEVIGFILTNPNVGFKIFKDDKLYKHFPVADQASRVQTVLSESAENLTTIESKKSQLKISGYVIRPGLCRTNKKHQYLFVNGRRIEDYRLNHAIREAYIQSAGIEKHLHPLFVIMIHLDPILVDVNVHPRKLEVKFAEPSEIYSALKMTILSALEHNRSSFQPSAQPTTFSQPKFTGGNQSFGFGAKKFSKAFNNSLAGNFSQRSAQRTTFADSDKPNTIPQTETNTATQSESEYLTLSGQIANKYIAAEDQNGLWLFDQHALHERQRFEIFWNEYLAQKKSGTFLSQKLLIPQGIKSTLEEVNILFEKIHHRALDNLGFSLKLIDDESFEVHSINKSLAGEDLDKIFSEFAQYFAQDKVGEHALDMFMRKRLEYKSCRGAVMFGDPLEPAEMQKLLDDFLTTKWRNLCPHGRPNHIFIPFSDLNTMFHR